jgi:hypothetical protein
LGELDVVGGNIKMDHRKNRLELENAAINVWLP